MDKNKMLVLTILIIFLFIEIIVSTLIQTARATVIFQEGFESGNFNAWSGNYRYSGTASVQSSVIHHGSYAAKFALGTSTEATIEYYKTLATTYSTLYLRHYFRLENSIPNNNGILYINFMESTSDWVAGAAVYNSGGTLKWRIRYYDHDIGWFTWSALSSSSVSLNTWYCVEIKVTVGTSGEMRLYIDGSEVLSVTNVNLGTAKLRRVYIRATKEDWSTSQTLNAYHDCVVVSDTYIGPEEQPTISLKSSERYNRSSNLGTITFADTEHSLPDGLLVTAGTYQATYNPPPNCLFVQWVTSGGVYVNDVFSNPTPVQVFGNGTLKALYTQIETVIYKISIDSTKHNDYGLGYPVTYAFAIPAEASNLRAYKRHSQEENWIPMIEKTSHDFFNGIECARFDYDSNIAYISVAFSATSDNIYIKITDQNDNVIPTAFIKTAKYYDNRKAAVVASADDWGGDPSIHDAFMAACDAFQNRNVWLTIGIVTQNNWENNGGPPDWEAIQSQLDEGYIEAASHSRTHPTIPYKNYDSEIGGSKNDIIGNLTLPPLYRKGNNEYVWAWIEPYGFCDSTVRQKLGQYKYLIDRATEEYSVTGNQFVGWDNVNGLFERCGVSIITGGSASQLNSEFDNRYAAGEIYHFYFHPITYDWSGSNIITQHLDYIKNKTDVWYVGFGALYAYHFVENAYTIEIEESETLLTMGEFQAPSTVYANKYFLLNATIQNLKGTSNFVNATIEISNGIILKWDNTTNTFSKLQDTQGYCTLDASNSFRTTINSTAYKLSWKIKLDWAYPEGLVSIVSTNTKVFDIHGASASGSHNELFNFEDDLIIYSASVDDSRVNPSQSITFTGTLYYQGTTTPPEDTSSITIRISMENIEKASTTTISPSGTFTLSFPSESTVGSFTYTIFAVTDENSVQNQTVTIIVDRIKVSSYTISDDRANVGDNVNIDVTLVYEYDNIAVTTGTITINGYAAIHIGSGVYRITRTLSTVGSETYNTVAGSESTYNLITVNQNGKSTTVIWDLVIIDTFSVSDNRINFGSVASFTVAGKYAYDNTVWSGTYTLNDTTSKSAVEKYGYKISAITDNKYGLTVFQQTAPDLYVIFDRVKVSSGGVVDSRIDVNSAGKIWFELLYEYDLTPVSDGSVTFFGGKLATYGGNGKWWVNETQTSVAIVYYNVTEVDGNNHGITVINHAAPTQSIIWDEIKVISLTASHERIDVGSPATLTVQLIYEYDNSVVSSGSFTLNGLPLTYENGAWVARDTKSSVSAATYNSVDGTDGAYGLTLINLNGHSTTVIWDRVAVTLSVSDNRINVDATATITKTGFYEYDSTPFLGTITLNDTTTKSTVGKYGYTTSSISDPLYGLTAFTTNEVYCIFDRININTFSVLDNRINIGDTATFTVEGVYEYDSTLWLGSYALNDTATKITVGKYGYKIVSVTDSNYGLTAFRQTPPDIYVIFDRINVVTCGSDDTRRDVNTEATFYLTLEYEYDNSPVVDGVAYLNGSLPLTWSHANSRWEYKTIKTSVQKLTVHLISVSGNTHEITTLNPNTSNKTISVIWDRIKIADGGITKETLTLGETATIWFTATYEYDEKPFTSLNGTLYLNETQMTWSIPNMRWEYTYTANTIGTAVFKISTASDISQGLTTINDRVGAKTITVWSMPFSIISNSVITELAFDSTSKIITFTVSGQEGTIGYTNVTIAKTLIENISDLKIYLDGSQTNYVLTSTEYTWLIHFTYTHSSHKVIILLTPLNTNPQPVLSIKTTIALSGIIIIITATILIIRKKLMKTQNSMK